MASSHLDPSNSSESSVSSGQEKSNWEDVEADTEELEFLSLFDEEKFPDVNLMLQYCKEKHHFDFVKVQGGLKLDFYNAIKLVNYIRSETKKGNLEPDVSSVDKFGDDIYLKPVLENDALLFSLDSIDALDFENLHVTEQQAAPQGDASNPADRTRQLEAELAHVTQEFESYRAAVQQALGKSLGEYELVSDTAEKPKVNTTESRENGYFEAYSYNDIHETMLKDTVRTDAYRDFVYDYKHLFEGKVVLDIGCGTGILSMFCAQAGASKVIAVDNSNIMDKAQTIIKENGLDGTITCIKGKIEEVALPVEGVDIIISEWMGYGLLYEAMLKSVIWARDKYLKPSGFMVPSHTMLRIAPLTDPDYIEDSIHFWNNVYGFNMTAMQEKIYDEVLIRQVTPEAVAGSSFPFLMLNLRSVEAKHLTFTKKFTVTIDKQIDYLDGWAIWFDTFFLTPTAFLQKNARGETFDKTAGKGCAFTTGPSGKETHWKCAVLLVDRSKHQPQVLDKGATISGSVSYSEKGSNARGLEIEVTWDVEKTNRYGQQVWTIE